MPNVGHRWTSEEEAAALATETYEDFARFYPDISREAYRIRRQTLRRIAREVSGLAPNGSRRCKVCAFLARLLRKDRELWEADLSKPVKRMSHRAVELALRASGVAVDESSIRRHRRNHLGS